MQQKPFYFTNLREYGHWFHFLMATVELDVDIPLGQRWMNKGQRDRQRWHDERHARHAQAAAVRLALQLKDKTECLMFPRS